MKRARLSVHDTRDILTEKSSENDYSDSDTENSISDAIGNESEVSSDSSNEVGGFDNSETDTEPSSEGDLWSRHVQANSPFSFIATTGLNVDLANTNDPLCYFELFFDDGLVDMIVVETNRFAEQCKPMRDKLKARSRGKLWISTTSKEMRVYFALMILQGIIHKPEQEMYWTKKPNLETPFFGTVMSRSRFLAIMKYLHFVNNETFDADNDPCPKLFKLKPVLDYLSEKFMRTYTPERNISVDESLMLWKGRLGWKQYIPIKRD